MRNELESIQEEAVTVRLKALSWHLSARAVETHNKPVGIAYVQTET